MIPRLAQTLIVRLPINRILVVCQTKRFIPTLPVRSIQLPQLQLRMFTNSTGESRTSDVATTPVLQRQPSAPKRTASQRNRERLRLESEGINPTIEPIESIQELNDMSQRSPSRKKSGADDTDMTDVAAAASSPSPRRSPSRSPVAAEKLDEPSSSPNSSPKSPSKKKSGAVAPKEEDDAIASPSPSRRGRAKSNGAAASSSPPISSPTPEPSASPKVAGGKRKKSGAAAVAATSEVTSQSDGTGPVSQSQSGIPEADDEDEQPAAKKPRGSRKKSGGAAAKNNADVDAEADDAEAVPLKKKGRAKSAVAAAAVPEDEAEPLTKKGKSKSTPAAASSSKKKKSGAASAGGSQEEGEEGGGGAGFFESEVARAVAAIEAAKRAARPAGSKTLLSWNVNGLRAALRVGLATYLNQVDADVIALCEVKADEAVVKKEFDRLGEEADTVISPIATAFGGGAPAAPKYHKYFNCCTVKKGYSGVAILSKVKPISVTNGIGQKKHDEEGRAITAEYADYYIVCTYVPNSGDGLKRLTYRTTEWDVDLVKYLKELEKKKPVIWTGDLNVAHHDFDIHNPKTNQKSAGFTPQERASFGLVVGEHGFVDVFHRLYPEPSPNRYTYFGYRQNNRASGKGWRLDYWVVSPKLMDSHVIDTWIGSELTEVHRGQRRSDHLPIFLNIK